IRRELWVGHYLNYFTHPYFKEYPVVGISVAQANKYCEWFTLEFLKKHPDFKSDFRLPTQFEMQYAAVAGLNNRIYPWNSNSVLGSCNCLMANFNLQETGAAMEDHAGQDEFYLRNFSKQNSIDFF